MITYKILKPVGFVHFVKDQMDGDMLCDYLKEYQPTFLYKNIYPDSKITANRDDSRFINWAEKYPAMKWWLMEKGYFAIIEPIVAKRGDRFLIDREVWMVTQISYNVSFYVLVHLQSGITMKRDILVDPAVGITKAKFINMLDLYPNERLLDSILSTRNQSLCWTQ